jgi:hypothetical protein
MIKYKAWHEKYCDKSGDNIGFVDVEGTKKWELETGKKSQLTIEMPILEQKYFEIYSHFLKLRRFFSDEYPISYETMLNYFHNECPHFDKNYFFEIIKHLDSAR